jgi:hypothetical protein
MDYTLVVAFLLIYECVTLTRYLLCVHFQGETPTTDIVQQFNVTNVSKNTYTTRIKQQKQSKVGGGIYQDITCKRR